MTTDIYRPPNTETLDQLQEGQVRLGLQGPQFSGKTTAALTFPNPVALNFDRKVSAHTHRSDVINVPFYDGAFCDKIVPRSGLKNPPNRRDALLKWLLTEGIKLTPNQTAIFDNCTGIDEAFHSEYRLNPVYTKGGEEDGFAEWRMKKIYFGELHAAMKALKCNVVFIAHETADRDKKGELNGKWRPLLDGQTGDRLGANFTDWFRAITVTKPETNEEVKKFLEWAKCDKSTLDEWLQQSDPIHRSLYLWQTQPSGECDCGTTTLLNAPRLILANYSQFAKYKRKQTN